MDYGKYQDVIEHVKSVVSAYDFTHTCRVLNYAVQILDDEKKADKSVVVLSAILHDIARTNPNNEFHARTGSEQAKTYLVEHGYSEELAERVANCILTHSNNSETTPQTLEAKILFDADKLDKTGAVGTLRAIIECNLEGEQVYVLGEDGFPRGWKKKEPASLLRRYRQNLRKLGKFHTDKAKKIAARHQQAMDDYFEQLAKEIEKNYEKGSELLQKYCA